MRQASLLMALIACTLAGCASVFTGSLQTVTVNASPGDAVCQAEQKGVLIGGTSGTTNVLGVPNSRERVTLHCAAPGFQPADFVLMARAKPWGVISSWTVVFGPTDLVTGGIQQYSKEVAIALKPIDFAPGQTVHCLVNKDSVISMPASECYRLKGRPLDTVKG
jgi:hypothetical protein